MLLPRNVTLQQPGRGEMTDDGRDKIHRLMPQRELKRSPARTRSVIIAVRLILPPPLLIAGSVRPSEADDTRDARVSRSPCRLKKKKFEKRFYISCVFGFISDSSKVTVLLVHLIEKKIATRRTNNILRTFRINAYV